MRIRAFVYAALAIVTGAPAVAAATAGAIATVSPTAGVAAGATVQITCFAEGRNATAFGSGETIESIAVNIVGGGTLSATQIPGAVASPVACQLAVNAGASGCNVFQGSVSWTTPANPATLSASCTASYVTTGPFGGGSTGTVTSNSASLTTIAAALPPVVSAITGPAQVVAGAAAVYGVTATDPSTPPQPLTYAWSVTGGAITATPRTPRAPRGRPPTRRARTTWPSRSRAPPARRS